MNRRIAWLTLVLLAANSRERRQWEFTGKAFAGPLAGKPLAKVAVLHGYWFDWKTYDPNIFIYDPGNR